VNLAYKQALEPLGGQPIHQPGTKYFDRPITDMLSVIIPTRNSERTLVPTLAALVPGATAGLIAEVLITDGGSQDDTAGVADVAGCNFLIAEGVLAQRLEAAAAAARMPWLMFVRPGIVLDTPWTGEVARFLQQDSQPPRAAVFRRGTSKTGMHELLLRFAAALGAPPRPEQGLLIAREFYQALGGHSEAAGDPERDLLRRIGRRRIARLSTQAFGSV
jgi:glycosyltransferase involved in cell wall biosynthesis